MSIEKKNVREEPLIILGKSPTGLEVGRLGNMYVQKTTRDRFRNIFSVENHRQAIEIASKQLLPMMQRDLTEILMSSMRGVFKKIDSTAFKVIGELEGKIKSWKDEKGRIWIDLVEK